jgi:hypothetical protein
MREAIANVLRSTTMLIHSHIARIIPPKDIKGLVHALHSRIIHLLISLHIVVSVAMATKKTPTVRVTDTQTSARGHKKAIEDVITRNQARKKAVATELIRIVRTPQTV